jgi:hypothetical protein
MQQQKNQYFENGLQQKKGSFVTWCGEYSKNMEPE